MKIKYEFADETIEIEVSEDWGAVLIELDRQEYNNDHAETRRHCSLDQLTADGNDCVACSDDVEDAFLISEDNKKLYAAIKKLEPRQQYLIEQVYFLGRKQVDLAAEEGVSHVAITYALQRAVKKLKKFLA